MKSFDKFLTDTCFIAVLIVAFISLGAVVYYIDQQQINTTNINSK